MALQLRWVTWAVACVAALLPLAQPSLDNNAAPALPSLLTNPTLTPTFQNTPHSTQQDVAAISDQQLQINIDKAHEDFGKSAKLDLSTSVIQDALSQVYEIANAISIVKDVSDVVKCTLSFFPIVGAIFGIFSSIFSFTLFKSANSVMRDEFKVVNQKLDAITLQLRTIKEELNVNTEFHAWMSTYIEWEYNIKNGELKLSETLTIFQTFQDERTRLKAAKAFVDYFREQNIEGSILNVLRISTSGSNSVTAPNLLELFARENKCDIKGLSLLMLTLMDLTVSATKQLYLYSLLAYGSEDVVNEQVMKIYDQYYHSRRYYQETVYSCYANSVKNAKLLTSNILTEKHGLEGYALTEYIHTQLSESAPWYKWAVGQYEKVFILEDDKCLNVQGRGQDYFTSQNNDHKVFVLWQDPTDNIPECNRIEYARNLIPFEPCEGCDNYMIFGDTFVAKPNCTDYVDTILGAESCIGGLYTFSKDPREKRKQYKTKIQSKTSFIASGVKPKLNICYSNGCNGHGECRPMPYTNDYMCICEPYYGGNDCDQNLHPSTLQVAADVLDKMRNNLGQYIGVPDDVDVFLALRSFSDQLAQTRTSIISSIKYQQILTSYGQEFDDAEYIGEKYNSLLNGILTEHQFVEDVKSINFNFNFFFSNLKRAILGTGLFLNSDLLYHYKRSLVDIQPCTEAYNNEVEKFMNNILKFDEVISEAEIRFKLGQLNGQDIDQVKETMERLGTAASQRQATYKQHWQQESCPSLPVLSSCGSYTYQGLTVSVVCPRDTRPVPEVVSCQRRNGFMEWSATPVCERVWGSWGAWSTCTRSCGSSGRQTRYRTNSYDKAEQERRPCNEIDCCHPSFNRFKCSNNVCLATSRVCDGYNDCLNNDDESRERCNYLRSGDRMALKDRCYNKWMSGSGSYFELRTCPGDSMDGGDWDGCDLERFDKIVAKDRDQGEAIRYGDKVAIMFRNKKWVSHYYSKYIYQNYCPGYSMDRADWTNCEYEVWTIYAPARIGSCSGSVYSDCKGEPIQKGDVVFFRGDTSDRYLSAGSCGWLLERGCPGHSITSSSLNSCHCEQWVLNI